MFDLREIITDKSIDVKYISDQASFQEKRTPAQSMDVIDAFTNATKWSRSSSLSILLSVIKDRILMEGTANATARKDRPMFDEVEETKRCERYGFTFDKSITKRRRIFAGSLLENDEPSWHALFAHALETYGIYHSVVFLDVSEEKTQERYEQGIPRFLPGSENLKLLVNGTIFGPATIVQVAYLYKDDNPDKVPYYLGENIQREKILQLWKKNGMEEDDIGLLANVDETFTRDFLMAAQTCEIEKWPRIHHNEDEKINTGTIVRHNSCRGPIIRGSSIFFEGSPLCIQRGGDALFKRWLQPSMIIGECINWVGSSEIHPPAERQYKGIYGNRLKGYGARYDWSKWGRNDTYPLFNAADFRRMNNGLSIWQSGYHFEHFFDNTAHVRWSNKQKLMTRPLGTIKDDLNKLVECVIDRPGNTDTSNLIPLPIKNIDYHDQNYAPLEFLLKENSLYLPIAFQSKAYVLARHKELRAIITKDEAKYGGNGN